MISGIAWRWDEASEMFIARLESPPRDLTIRWDQGDRNFYLAVNAGPVPNMPGSVPRAWVGPLSLLAVTLVLPVEFHDYLRAQAQWAYHEVADGVILDALHHAIDTAPRGFPAATQAREHLERAAAAGPLLERLAFDLASAGAWSG